MGPSQSCRACPPGPGDPGRGSPVVFMLVQLSGTACFTPATNRKLAGAHASQPMLSRDHAKPAPDRRHHYQGREPRETKVYTHNPWMLPRLACAALFLTGISNILYQNLIVCLALYGLYLLCLGRLGSLASVPVLLFSAFSTSNLLCFFRPLFNQGRAWHFPLFSPAGSYVSPGRAATYCRSWHSPFVGSMRSPLHCSPPARPGVPGAIELVCRSSAVPGESLAQRDSRLHCFAGAVSRSALALLRRRWLVGRSDATLYVRNNSFPEIVPRSFTDIVGAMAAHPVWGCRRTWRSRFGTRRHCWSLSTELSWPPWVSSA